jgi:4-diphosphocytidyl-2-C-methyl-D-erythritol kinase
VWRAAEALWTSTRRPGELRGLAIHLVKRIPVQSGLGGGSSDAAATLRALALIWCADATCVRDAAVRLGADVPFFLEGGTVLGLERGDVLFPLIDAARAWVVLVIPPFGISTPDAYRWWDKLGTDRGRTGDGVGTESGPSPKVLGNDLQAPVAQHYPEIDRMVRDLTRAGATAAAMSGSGSAVFGLFPTENAARRAARVVARPDRRVLVTRTLTRAAYQRLAAK